MTFRKVRRHRHDDRKGPQAADSGADETFVAGGYAGAGTWHAVPANQAPDLGAISPWVVGPGGYPAASAIATAGGVSLIVGNVIVQHILPPEPAPSEPLPREIRAGEIVAYRAWEVRLVDGKVQYRSMHIGSVWEDGEMRCDTAAGEALADYECAGVHAWKTERQAHTYAVDAGGPAARTTYAIGEVELWGEVVEHDLGYRAEFGQIRRITHLVHGIRTSPMHEFYIDDSGMVAVRATNPPFKPYEFVDRAFGTVGAFLLALGLLQVIRVLLS